MSTLMTGMTLLLCITLIGAAIVAIRDKRLPIAILAAGLVSLIASILFLILAAPDVAMTEAAIGSGLTTFLFFFVLARVRGGEMDGTRMDGTRMDGTEQNGGHHD
jgi:uncharacterized MnhB-related membrane protein